MEYHDQLRRDCLEKLAACLDGRLPFPDLASWAAALASEEPEGFPVELINAVAERIVALNGHAGDLDALRPALESLRECLDGRRPLYRQLIVQRDLTFYPGQAEKHTLAAVKEYLEHGSLRHRVDVEGLLDALDPMTPEGLLCQEALFTVAQALGYGRKDAGGQRLSRRHLSRQDGSRALWTEEDVQAHLEVIAGCLEGEVPYSVGLRFQGPLCSTTLAFSGAHGWDQSLASRVRGRYRRGGKGS